MIVYVESNFVLEVALGQEEASSAEAILTLAENSSIELVFPGFALSEPFSTITHRKREQQRMSSSLAEMVRQLQRSEPHKQVVTDLLPIPNMLTNLAKTETNLLQSTVKRLFQVSRAIETNAAIFEQALVYQFLFELSPQDSIIYATVITDLRRKPRNEIKYFISRNWKDFRDFSIKYELESYNCQYVENFEDGLSLIQSSIHDVN